MAVAVRRTIALHADQDKSFWPTRKWWAAAVTAFTGIVGTWASTGWHWTNALSGAAIAVVGQLAVAYLVPNLETPGGVPTRSGSHV